MKNLTLEQAQTLGLTQAQINEMINLGIISVPEYDYSDELETIKSLVFDYVNTIDYKKPVGFTINLGFDAETSEKQITFDVVKKGRSSGSAIKVITCQDMNNKIHIFGDFKEILSYCQTLTQTDYDNMKNPIALPYYHSSGIAIETELRDEIAKIIDSKDWNKIKKYVIDNDMNYETFATIHKRVFRNIVVMTEDGTYKNGFTMSKLDVVPNWAK